MWRLRALATCALLVLACREGGCNITEAEVVASLASAYCDATWDAGCEGPSASRVECKSHLERVGDETRDRAHELGLVFQADCAEQLRDAYEAHDGPDGPPKPGGPRRCRIWLGRARVGESCKRDGELDTCAQGLHCDVLGVCVVDEPPLDQGADCVDIDATLACGDELTCLDGACALLPRLGEACLLECDDHLVCDDEVCVAAPKAGEPCADVSPSTLFECGRDQMCVEGVCERRTSICAEPPPW